MDAATKLLTLAEFLKQKRTEAGLSQKDVSTKLGYSTSQFISNWERGVSQPPIQTVRTLADMYKVKPDVMFEVLLESHINEVKVDMRKKFSQTVGAKKA